MCMSLLKLLNKLLPIEGLKTTEIYTLTVLEPQSLKSRCGLGSEGQGENLFHD